jgi:O-antigen ligase
MFREAPLVGRGASAFAAEYPERVARLALPPGYRPDDEPVAWPHDLYLEVLAERGLLGLAGFAALPVAAGLALRRARRRTRDRAVAAGTEACLAAGAAFLVMAAFDLTFRKDWVLLAWLLLPGLAAALVALAAQPPAGERQQHDQAGAGGGDRRPD